MYKAIIPLRVRYGETDQMGYVYYGQYASYFEVARVEALRKLGFSYKAMEDEGVVMPVLSYTIDYLLPGHYDDVLDIHVQIPTLPRARIRFDYETYRKDVLLNRGHTLLAFLSKEKGHVVRLPQKLHELLLPYYA